MRNAMVVSILASATLVGTLISGAAAAAHASSNNGNGNQNTISGTLVATPQSTLPATLMLQSGSQTLAVVVTSSTQVTDDNGNTLSLSSMTDGDSLQVVGAGSGQPGSGQGPSGPGNGGQSRNHDQWRGKQSSQHAGTTSNKITAASIVDLSVSSSSGSGYTVNGTLDEAYSGVLCLSSASVTSAIRKLETTTNPCASADMPVYVSSSTTYEDVNAATILLTALSTGDSLTITGVLSSGSFEATLVQDLSETSTTTTTATVTGTLDEQYSGVLCLSSASVTTSDLKLHQTADTVCSTGDLPVYVTSSTAYENSSSTTVTLSDLATGDSLSVAGTISDGEFAATTVQDLSN
jgi:hypothetical protein